MSTQRGRIAAIILTHNRANELRRTLVRMLALPEQPEIVVVDNASCDGTSGMVAADFPAVQLVRLDENVGAAARNAGVRAVRTPYVAFCDDDTWWAPGALALAVEMLDAHPGVAVLSARVLVGEEEREDPTCAVMAESPLPADDLPGPALLGFLAGACVMRREAFVQAGGYEPNFFLGGEESLLTLDLVAAGWRVVYVAQLTVHHHPSSARDAGGRERCLVRNAIWLTWMRLPWRIALRDTLRVCRKGRRSVVMPALREALRGMPWVLRKRHVLPEHTLLLYRMLRDRESV